VAKPVRAKAPSKPSAVPSKPRRPAATAMGDRKSKRDEFSASVRRRLRDEVGNVCSLCARPTSGPSESKGAVISGEAGHIRGAKATGPRGDATMTAAQRKAAENGIWLCGKCHPIVDGDHSTHTIVQLQAAKERAIADARRRHLTGSAPGPDPRQVAVATDALKAVTMLCNRIHHALRETKRAVEVAGQGSQARADADSSLDFIVQELMSASSAYTEQVEKVGASFPTASQPIMEMMTFNNFASTVTVQFAYQWKERFRGERRRRSAMETENPYDRICDWSKAFEGVDPDAGIVDEWARAHSRRMTSLAAHIGQGLIPDAWWALREEEERQELERLKQRARANGHNVP
jgi:hypothetical protein